mmetsp:Transcript_19296/g.44730  ORF Transcript_19296/g.44730 Transcript_19296/m.44730 type:complete len:146 (-) Transcript_19296:351-788(-)
MDNFQARRKSFCVAMYVCMCCMDKFMEQTKQCRKKKKWDWIPASVESGNSRVLQISLEVERKSRIEIVAQSIKRIVFRCHLCTVLNSITYVHSRSFSNQAVNTAFFPGSGACCRNNFVGLLWERIKFCVEKPVCLGTDCLPLYAP